MKKFKVTRIMQYTETVYIEADSENDAIDNSAYIEGIVNNDEAWYDSIAEEITDSEYEEAGV